MVSTQLIRSECEQKPTHGPFFVAPSVHLFAPLEYIENHSDVWWLNPQKTRWSSAKKWSLRERCRRIILLLRWYLSSCHLHLKKKIWIGKKYKDPSCSTEIHLKTLWWKEKNYKEPSARCRDKLQKEKMERELYRLHLSNNLERMDYIVSIITRSIWVRHLSR